MSHSARSPVLKFAVGSILLVAGCGTPEAFHDTTLDAGLVGRGGTVGTGTGGAIVGTGGMIAGTGGVTPSSGGTTGTGGSPGTGGTPSSGGAMGTGGRGTGGTTPSTGGATGTGGRGTGGTTPSTGGATGTGGRGTGGTTSTGGMTSTGGRGTGGATGTGGMATGVLFMDDFESGAGRWTAQPPADWSVVTDGSMVYREGGALSTTTRLASPSVTNLTDISVQARVKVLQFSGQSSSYTAMVIARFRDSSNFYYAALDSQGKVAIKKNTPSASNSTINSVAGGIVVNTWYTVRFQVVGSTLSAYVDGALKVTATDSDIPSGGIGLGTRNATAVFDDVRVTTAP